LFIIVHFSSLLHAPGISSPRVTFLSYSRNTAKIDEKAGDDYVELESQLELDLAIFRFYLLIFQHTERKREADR